MHCVFRVAAMLESARWETISVNMCGDQVSDCFLSSLTANQQSAPLSTAYTPYFATQTWTIFYRAPKGKKYISVLCIFLYSHKTFAFIPMKCNVSQGNANVLREESKDYWASFCKRIKKHLNKLCSPSHFCFISMNVTNTTLQHQMA